MSNPALRLMIVDDHVLFRRGLVSLLQEMPEFHVVGEAGNGKDALPIIQQTRPDIILLDVNMPVMDGIAALQAIRAERTGVRVLMLTISQQDDDLLGAIKAGADGYVLKNTEPDELRRSILRLAQGHGVLSPEVTHTVLRSLARGSHEAVPILSDRELEVLRCLATGQTTQQISRKLYISDNTVKTHIRHILEKLGASNRTEAVSKALQVGLINR